MGNNFLHLFVWSCQTNKPPLYLFDGHQSIKQLNWIFFFLEIHSFFVDIQPIVRTDFLFCSYCYCRTDLQTVNLVDYCLCVCLFFVDDYRRVEYHMTKNRFFFYRIKQNEIPLVLSISKIVEKKQFRTHYYENDLTAISW